MMTQHASEYQSQRSDVRNNGAAYGAVLGLLSGVFISGPYLGETGVDAILAICAISSALMAAAFHIGVALIRADEQKGRGDRVDDSIDAADALLDIDGD